MPDGGIVAILFTDLVGSTTMYDRLGDVEAERIRREHFALLRHQLLLHGGTEVKNAGDGLMVVFPSAVRAVDAACAMQRAAAARNLSSGGHQADIRIGINVGEPLQDERDYFGIAVNTSRRLCDAAPANEIYVSSLVRALVAPRSATTFVALGALELKGLVDPVDAFAVDWRRDERGAVHEMPSFLRARTDADFVGRDPELDLLRTAWKRTVAGERICMLLSGEPGIGKTRIAGELARIAEEDGVVLGGQCDPELVSPFQPFVASLAPAVDGTPSPAIERALADNPESGRLFRHGGAADWREDGGGALVMNGLIAVLDAAAASAPLLLVLDDMHWADEASVAFLRHLLRATIPRRVLVVITYRDTDIARDLPFSNLLADLRSAQTVERIALRGLAAQAIEEILGATNDDDQLIALARRIENETEGNPFFVRELITHLVETGALHDVAGRWSVVAPPEELGVPEGVREVVGRRLTRLSPRCNEVLAVAAVVGRGFSLRTLAAVTQTKPLDVLEALEEAVTARLVVADDAGPESFSFSHALVRHTLYQELSTVRRLRLHNQVADVMQKAGGPPLEIAHHYLEAGMAADPDHAAAWALLACHIIYNFLGGEVDGAAVAGRALELLDAAESPSEWLRFDLLVTRADALYTARRWQEADGLMRDAITVANRLLDPARYARAITVMARSSGAGELTTRAAALLDQAPDGTPPVAFVRMKGALALGRNWPQEDVAALLDEARALGDPEAITYAVVAHGDALMAQGRYAEARALFLDQIERAAAIEAVAIVPFWNRLINTALGLGDRAEATRYFAELRTSRFGALYDVLAQTGLLDALLAVIEGRLDDAEAAAMQRLAQDTLAASGVGPILIVVARERDQTQEMLALLDGIEITEHAVVAARCLFVAEAGEHDRALGGAPSVADLAPGHSETAVALALLAELAYLTGDRDLAGQVATALAPWRGVMVLNRLYVHLGAASYYLGLCEATLGRFEEAERSLRDAIGANDAAGAALWATQARVRLAQLLADRARPDEATALAREASTVARDLRLPRLERLAQALA